MKAYTIKQGTRGVVINVMHEGTTVPWKVTEDQVFTETLEDPISLSNRRHADKDLPCYDPLLNFTDFDTTLYRVLIEMVEQGCALFKREDNDWILAVSYNDVEVL